VASPVDQPALHGTTILITGGNSGIGKEAAVALARMGAHVAITARNPSKGEAARKEIIERSGNNTAEDVPLDLASLESVRTTADNVLAKFDRIDVLVNNAGGTLSKRQVTQDGFEMTFGVNHLGHFLLTNLLLDRVEASAPARIITVASGAHRGARKGLDFDDLQLEEGHYRGFQQYCRSKLANIMFANELAHRLDGTKVTSNSMHPGYVRTNFAREGDTGAMGVVSYWLGRPFSISPEKGADTIVYLASSPEVEGVTGQYFYKRQLTKTSPYASDEAAQRRLWEISEQLVGLTPAR
jgi:NAD(P)-dependent dehydrogenase (short-subunit alcohol dehydrogenase family)